MPTFFALVAQWIERHVSNLWVGGSIPSEGTGQFFSLKEKNERNRLLRKDFQWSLDSGIHAVSIGLCPAQCLGLWQGSQKS